MKKLYIAFALCAATGWASAQVSVTLRVDMSNETVSPDGVHVAGSFQGWDPAGTPMTDANMDGIYEHTFEATTAGPIEFKFVNGNAWGSDESVPSACGPAPGGDNNRFVVVDLAGGDIGDLIQWDLKITTASSGCSSSVAAFCTSSTTTNGCNPRMSSSATSASIAAGAGSFILTATNVEGQKSGLIFYSITGTQNLPWSTGSTSFLCVKAPTQRTLTQNTGGTAATCTGTLTLDWNAFQAANPTALGNPWAAGNKAQVQAWFRDPPAGKSTNLSNAIDMTYVP